MDKDADSKRLSAPLARLRHQAFPPTAKKEEIYEKQRRKRNERKKEAKRQEMKKVGSLNVETNHLYSNLIHPIIGFKPVLKLLRFGTVDNTT